MMKAMATCLHHKGPPFFMGIFQVAISQIEVLATPPNNKELNLAQSQSTIEENAEPLSISIYLEN